MRKREAEVCLEAVYDRHKLSRETGHYESLFAVTILCTKTEIELLRTIISEALSPEAAGKLVEAMLRIGRVKMIIRSKDVAEKIARLLGKNTTELSILGGNYYYILSMSIHDKCS